jgi:hypoxanthine phosphoribosyltransferase
MSASSGFPRLEPFYVADGTTYSLEHFALPAAYKGYLSSVLLPHGLVVDRVEKLAADICAAYPDSTPHILVVLKGGSEFATDLTRTLRRLHAYKVHTHLPFTVDYVRVKSYEGTSSTGNVTISGIDMKTLAGRDIIIVEDIIDTGLTMTRLVPELERHGIKSVRVAALLEKRTPKSCGFKADFVGFSVPDAFVVGYNLDYNEAFREMPRAYESAQPRPHLHTLISPNISQQHTAFDPSDICVISSEGIEHFKSHPILRGLC